MLSETKKEAEEEKRVMQEELADMKQKYEDMHNEMMTIKALVESIVAPLFFMMDHLLIMGQALLTLVMKHHQLTYIELRLSSQGKYKLYQILWLSSISFLLSLILSKLS
uniref:Uncharacterized protein n=1 Tax=Ananas comosus var. bracteatus TaxID=296719 RepID=A0A6V7QI74_ANACO|nr:unnamed protein product [Ananas comosus var. bracteatus]